MTGVVTNKFRVLNAQQFYEAFAESEPSIIYSFIGRCYPWSDDNNPPTPGDNLNAIEFDIWRDIMSVKRVTSSDISFCIRRVDWTSNTVYSQYDTSNSSMYDSNFFVFTDDYNVYKCLSNFNGESSTVKPTGTSTSAFTTSDGYKWKFMFSVAVTQAIKFLTTNYIPLQHLTANNGTTQWDVQQAAVNGAIENHIVSAGGTGYLMLEDTATAGSSSTITLPASASLTNGRYVDFGIYISSGTGAGQVRKVTSYTGSTRVATVSPNWSTAPDSTSQFVLSPFVNLNGDGSGYLGYAVVDSGAVTAIQDIDIGENYSWANTTISANGGSGCTVVPQLAPKNGHGSNALEELAGRNVIINVRLSGTESNTITTENDFRIIGLIADPLYSDGSVANATNYSQMTTLALSSITGTFTKDEVVVGGTSNAHGYVIEVTTEDDMRLNAVKGTFSAAETVEGQTSGATAVVDTVTAGSLKPFSGEILYAEYRGPISRNPSQLEDLKLIVTF